MSRLGLSPRLLMLTSPLVWFYSEVALTYIVEAFFCQPDWILLLPAAAGRPAFCDSGSRAAGSGRRLSSEYTRIPVSIVVLYSLKGVPFARRVLGIVVLGCGRFGLDGDHGADERRLG